MLTSRTEMAKARRTWRRVMGNSSTRAYYSQARVLMIARVVSRYRAAQIGYLQIAKLLLESYVDINTRNGDDKTPLNLAVGNGKREETRFII
jgi:ankyrin repeat protein